MTSSNSRSQRHRKVLLQLKWERNSDTAILGEISRTRHFNNPLHRSRYRFHRAGWFTISVRWGYNNYVNLVAEWDSLDVNERLQRYIGELDYLIAKSERNNYPFGMVEPGRALLD